MYGATAAMCTATRPSLKTAAELRARYTISTGADAEYAAEVALAHAREVALWTSHRHVPAHTLAAFEALVAWRRSRPQQQPLVLDIGCGTGRSSNAIALEHPEWDVVGIDRNATLLKKGGLLREAKRVFPTADPKSEASADLEESMLPPRQDGSTNVKRRRVTQVDLPENLLVLRADFNDLLRLACDAQMRVAKMFFLYPNPYPKRSDIKSRIYGNVPFRIPNPTTDFHQWQTVPLAPNHVLQGSSLQRVEK